MPSCRSFVLLMLILLWGGIGMVGAQEPTLSNKQRNLAARYAQLENILLRMAEIDAQTNPKRSALLKKVLAESKERLIHVRFSDLIDILERQRLTEAISGQTELSQDLNDLLRLLESENRAQRRDAEKERLTKLLKEINALIHREKSLKGKTQRSEETGPLEPEQQEIHEATDRLADAMTESQEIGPRSPRQEPEKKAAENKNSDAPDPEKKSAPEKQDSDDDPVEADKDQSPTQQAMQRSMKRMQRAQKRLRESRKNEAVEEQEEAVAELQKAKAELDRILRQLREEELMQTLQWLDARIKKMLQAEKMILTQTQKVAAESTGEPAGETEQANAPADRLHGLRTGRVAADQAAVILDADAALIVLREDGTAQAMTESLAQTRFDMVDVQERLARGDAGALTQEIEQSIIQALEEMLDVIEAAKKESEKRQQQQAEQQAGGGASEDEQRLIDILSELRMIRQMQTRVNDRTQRYERMAVEPNADLPTLGRQVEELARQQSRIARILNTIKVGKNE